MEQPEGFAVPGKEKEVFKLMNSLYGLKQAPKQWHTKFDQTILSNEFKIDDVINVFTYSELGSHCMPIYGWHADDDQGQRPQLIWTFILQRIKVKVSLNWTMQSVGNLMYVMICTWPDIAYTISKVIWYTSNPNQIIGWQWTEFWDT